MCRGNIHQFWAAPVSDIVFPRQHPTIVGSARILCFHICCVAQPLYQAMLDRALIDIPISASCVPRAAGGARSSSKLVQLGVTDFI